MKILVACEESQRVCIAFRVKGHEAYSCDIIDCSGGHKEWHIKQNVLDLLDGNCEFLTVDGNKHIINGKWDMIIAFPPCTHLTVSGARHFQKKREDGRQQEGIEFFGRILQANCDKIAIENPVGIIGGKGEYIKKWFPELCKIYNLPRQYSQVIQPYEYGHPISKKTCLWLKNLPLLQPTNIVDPEWITKNGKRFSGNSWHAVDDNGKILSWDNPKTAIERSKTFEGIANAMADQWSKI